MDDGPAGIDYVWHITFPLVLIWFKQGLREPADYFAGILTIQEKGADAISPHGANAMA
jgi:hypothetical protein